MARRRGSGLDEVPRTMIATILGLVAFIAILIKVMKMTIIGNTLLIAHFLTMFLWPGYIGYVTDNWNAPWDLIIIIGGILLCKIIDIPFKAGANKTNNDTEQEFTHQKTAMSDDEYQKALAGLDQRKL